ncbi:MAG: TIGR00730 family Rossman fold protein [Deltaproteobacteria bacterium]|nr:TIGR00730 family Rossman fold protein [Deltaproteobacteria bacterium]MBI3295188.1 TIGR00730 family Rossman fold protein [Deltaproteobacteria bacterium]
MSNTIDKKGTDWSEVERLVASVAKDQKPAKLKLLNEILKAALKLARDNPGTLNLKISASVLKELRFSFKMFAPHRNNPKITMFGSARVPADTPLYKLAKDFAAEAVKRDFMVITGGGPGIMAAGNEGAAGDKGFGLNIRLPFEQDPNPFIDSAQRLIHYKYFFTRKLFLVKEAAAFAFFPGGFGTFDEAFEVLTLIQTGKTTLIPVALVEPKGFGFWEGFNEFVDKCLAKKKFINATDVNLYKVFHSPKLALDHIQRFYKNYHSMRFVRDQAVIRLKNELSPKTLEKLGKKFANLSMDRQFLSTRPLVEEENEPELSHLPRLVFKFDRQSFGNLRGLIDFINDNS